MAKIAKCPSCDGRVSTAAAACPHCGHQFQSAGGISLHVVGILLTLLLVGGGVLGAIMAAR